MSLRRLALGLGFTSALLTWWHFSIAGTGSLVVPTPVEVAFAIAELAQKGLLLKYVVASLFRVAWGYSLAVALAIPIGLLIGSHRWAELTFNPLLQLLRPISPLAWIPISILWLGVGDTAAIFLIFLAAFFPVTLTAINAVRSVDFVHIRAGRNFGLGDREILRQIVYPSVIPQLVTGMRVALGISWLVVVAAEMIAVNSGLGFLIVDARNAGNRYDLIVAGMMMIGVIGLILDAMMASLSSLFSQQLSIK